MIVVMDDGATPEQVARVARVAKARGLAPRVSCGSSGAVVAVDGDRSATSPLGALAGVSRLAPADGPYPLVAARAPGDRTTVTVGGQRVGPGTFSLVAGPCAVESAEQAFAACEAAVAAGATMLRGDLFKHRTSPYGFQGLGRSGVGLVAELRDHFGLPWVAEVLEPAHLELVTDVVDVVRVGARNMQNVELLRACGRSGRPVMLKRGLSATIDEWLLAAEYVASAGCLDVVLCERGIRTFEPSTRNTLDLSAVPVVRRRSHLPVVVDPSHATGDAELVAPMALAAVAAGADGVMVDVHPDPRTARCDGPQALRPEEILDLGGRLHDLAHRLRSVETPRDAVPAGS